MLIAAAIALLPRVAGGQGPDGVWSPLLPLPRTSHSAMYDPVRDRILIFGGYLVNDSDRALDALAGDVWEFSFADPGWKRLPTTGDIPPPLYLHSAIYDPVDDRMIVYGGTSAVYGTHDVWALSLTGTPTWTHLAPLGTPPPDRYSALAAYDQVRHRMVIFGGAHVTFGEPWSTLNDVWALSLGPNPEWSQILPSGAPPVARYYHYKGGIYDPLNDRLIVFGGNTYSSIYLNDLWALNLGGPPAWTQLTPQGDPPAARTFHSSVYDAAHGRMVVFGGGNGGGPLNDAWALSLDGSPVWSRLSPNGSPPSPREDHAAIYDPLRDRMVVWGRAPSGDVDSWSLSLTGAPTWSTLEPVNFPPRRSRAVTILDPIRGRIVLFGGRLEAGSGAGNDTWTLPLAGLSGWSALSASGTPPPERSGSAGVYDPLRDRVLIFGGSTSSPDDAVWSLDLGAAPAWRVLPSTGTPPSARSGHSLVYDTRRDRLLLYGGANLDGLGSNDLWSLSLAGEPAVWEQLAPTGTPPAPRSSHTALYDEDRDRMLMFSRMGYDFEVWELSLSPILQWRRLTPSGGPPDARDDHTTVFDSARNRILLFGGVTVSEGPNPMSSPFKDVWAFDLAGDGAWSRPVVTGVVPGVWAHGALYDGQRDRMVVCGGLTGSFGTLIGDTWALQLQGLVAVPSVRSRLALRIGALPNPSAGELGVSFDLPTAGAARIEVLDAAGRRVVSREVAPMGPGSHVIRLGVARRIPPGIYLLRLTQGSRRVSAKAAVVE